MPMNPLPPSSPGDYFQGVKTSPVWDAPTRWFHWINLVLVALLTVSGYFFMYREAFQVDGREAKMALKAAHVWIGYAFAVNLAWRIIWAFRGNPIARWRSILPDRSSLRSMGAELRDLIARRPVSHLVRSPISRLSASVMFAVLLLLALTGLVRAGTDLYHPPLGPVVAAFVAPPGTDPSAITWRTEAQLADPDRFQLVSRLKLVTGVSHKYGSGVLLGLIVLHIAGVTLSEVRQRSGIVSIMISGHRVSPEGGDDPGVPGERPAA